MASGAMLVVARCSLNRGMVTLQLRQLSVPPGQRLLIHDLSWGEFESILTELSDHRGSRLVYSKGLLEIRMPLPEHEVTKEIIGDMVKILLEELDWNRECFGSTAFKQQDMEVGIEPDTCFYIQNHALMVGKRRLDLSIDPPPDLVLEVDLTSKTQLDVYEALAVPELWRFAQDRLRIDVLREGKYEQSAESPTFPGLPVVDLISEFVVRSQQQGSSPVLRAFRQRVRELLSGRKGRD